MNKIEHWKLDMLKSGTMHVVQLPGSASYSCPHLFTSLLYIQTVWLHIWQQRKHEIIYLIPCTMFLYIRFDTKIYHTQIPLSSRVDIARSQNRYPTTTTATTTQLRHRIHNKSISGERLIFISNCTSLWSIPIKYRWPVLYTKFSAIPKLIAAN